ncbi:MAG: Dolichol-P-glucose synthetase [uncultured bacterium]|uniref:Dolichol-P-glucose synthetase n=2 Tax=Microgenomates group TaxID=1794810 RepID=A0A0G1M5R4_9BACT|nr:MAG: Dolichol-P-glucose synthetase [uncultured bacterium]KKT30721.1 MAG: Dolichol-P-glucose synthetase [Microgenomates group bacterium GW2011_GWC1_44_10]KKT49647.1 MAG: Dolichol-P-glucose synthetase [Candidatus Collierbacteria bacterium GW2011_GWC2_44_18]KKT67254.1 MAG: Dolichol-P-glucose synthetase [Candidatus Woesebacteria bacterium GW2011_GWA2_44_33]
MTPKLSIVISNYNEHANLKRGVLEQMSAYLRKAHYPWEVIINDDGSSDGGDKIVENYTKKHPGFRMIRGKHGGKAAGIWNAIQAAKGEIVLFTDMDQSTPLQEVEKLLPSFDRGYDVVFGSRGKMRHNFSALRQLSSWAFRSFRGMLLLHDVVDTQCGFKALRLDVAKKIFPLLSVIKDKKAVSKGWTVSAFDVELLFLAEKLGYKLKEVDVTWKNEDTSISKQKSFVGESIDMVKQIIQVKINDLTGKYDQK